MGKVIGFFLLIAAVLAVVNQDKIKNLKQQVIEVVNPAAKERRLLGDLSQSINELETVFSNSNKRKSLSAEDSQKFTAGIGGAKQILEELKDANQKTDLGANLSNLIQKLVPLPSKPSPTWLPPGQVCNK